LIIRFEPVVQAQLTLKLLLLSRQGEDLRKVRELRKGLLTEEKERISASLAVVLAAIGRYKDAERAARQMKGRGYKAEIFALLYMIRETPEVERGALWGMANAFA
jgi:hypothetical protein